MKRGEVWLSDLSPGLGREQTGPRPVLILSIDAFNNSGAELVVIVPITSKKKALTSRVEVSPPEGGLTSDSYVICEQPRTVDQERLTRKMGVLSPATMTFVMSIVRRILGL